METDQVQEDYVDTSDINRVLSGESIMVQSLLAYSDRRESFKAERQLYKWNESKTKVDSWHPGQSKSAVDFVYKPAAAGTKNKTGKKKRRSNDNHSSSLNVSCSQKDSSRNRKHIENSKLSEPRKQGVAGPVTSRGQLVKSLDVLSYESPSWRFIVNRQSYNYLPRAHPKLLAHSLPLAPSRVRPSSANSAANSGRKFVGILDPATFFDDQLAIAFKARESYIPPSLRLSEPLHFRQENVVISSDLKYTKVCCNGMADLKYKKVCCNGMADKESKENGKGMNRTVFRSDILPSLFESRSEEQLIYSINLNRHRLNIPIALTPVDLLSCDIPTMKSKPHGNELYQNGCQAHETFKLSSTSEGKNMRDNCEKGKKACKSMKNLEKIKGKANTKKSRNLQYPHTKKISEHNDHDQSNSTKIAAASKQQRQKLQDGIENLSSYYQLPFSKTMVLQTKRSEIHPAPISLPPLTNTSVKIKTQRSDGNNLHFSAYIGNGNTNKKLPSISGTKVDLSHPTDINSTHDLL